MKVVCEGCKEVYEYRPENATDVWRHRFCSVECWRKDAHYEWLAGVLASLWEHMDADQHAVLLKLLRNCGSCGEDGPGDRDTVLEAQEQLHEMGINKFPEVTWLQSIVDEMELFDDYTYMIESRLGRIEDVEAEKELMGTYRGFDVWKHVFMWQYPKSTLRQYKDTIYYGVCAERGLRTRDYGELPLGNQWSGNKQFDMKPPDTFHWSKASFGRITEYTPDLRHLFDAIDYICYYDISFASAGGKNPGDRKMQAALAQDEADNIEKAIAPYEEQVKKALKEVSRLKGKFKALQSDHFHELRLDGKTDGD
jgi:hypothetical protein